MVRSTPKLYRCPETVQPPPPPLFQQYDHDDGVDIKVDMFKILFICVKSNVGRVEKCCYNIYITNTLYVDLIYVLSVRKLSGLLYPQ